METNEVNVTRPTIMSIGLKFGAILGLLSLVISMVQIAIGISPFDNSWIRNVINIALTVAVIVFAHKSFKDAGDGFMTYGQGFLIALVTTLVSLVIGAIFTFLYFNVIDPSAFDAIWEKAAADMEAQGQSEEAIEMGIGIGKKFFWVFLLVGGIFWGCILGLIVSIFTQKKAPEAAF